MRRKDREITDLDQIEEIIKGCVVCRLALYDHPYPYIIPMNFGYTRAGDRFAFYFHSAHEGKKLDLMRGCPFASFEMDCSLELIAGQDISAYTMRYESVIGHGLLAIAEGVEKQNGLAALMRQVEPEKTFAFTEPMLDSVTIFRLDVETLTAKRNLPEGP